MRLEYGTRKWVGKLGTIGWRAERMNVSTSGLRDGNPFRPLPGGSSRARFLDQAAPVFFGSARAGRSRAGAE